MIFEYESTYVGLESNRGKHTVIVQPPLTAAEQRRLQNKGLCRVVDVEPIEGGSAVTVAVDGVEADVALKSLLTTGADIARDLSYARGCEIRFDGNVHEVTAAV